MEVLYQHFPLLTKTAPVILLKDGTGVFPSESGMTQ